MSLLKFSSAASRSIAQNLLSGTTSQQTVTHAVRVESRLILLTYLICSLSPLAQVCFDIRTPP
jgi:hypothetical protein